MQVDLDVAATLECEPELLPYLPELLQDFEALGSDPGAVCELLETSGAAADIRTALDLCCGKGAGSIALARRFGIRVDGVDALDAFVQSAGKAVDRAGVGHLCRFVREDIRDALMERRGYDLALFSAIGPILGGITATVTHLTRPVRDRGWIVIEDSVLLPGAPTRAGFEAHADLEETRRRIEASGVVAVESVHLDDGEVLTEQNAAEIEQIALRGRALVQRQPELSDLVSRYIDRQREECAYLERWTREARWLLRVAPRTA